MEVHVRREASGYGKPPWIFKGSALYQLHLVKAETARAFIPREFRLVEAFGYTLGGFFLASYDDSPAGVFDELVVIAGIVWNAPTSCAWAARVLVNSDEACDHGRKDVGLPSQVARFSKRVSAIQSQPASKISSFLSMIGMGAADGGPKHGMDVQVTEMMGPLLTDICTINLSTNVPEMSHNKKIGPAVNMSLPSFSGCTRYNPNLLKYSCRIKCRVRAVRPAKISRPSPTRKNVGQKPTDDPSHSAMNFTSEESKDNGRNLSISVMLSKPILALEFQCLEMQVEAPTVLSHCPFDSLKSC